MTPDTPPASVGDTVHAGERLRMELLDALRLALIKTERAAVLTETVMFYGQAFMKVYDVCARDPSAGPATVKVLHECICGLAIYRVWLMSETPVDPSEDCERMAAHWRKVTGMVLGEDG